MKTIKKMVMFSLVVMMLASVLVLPTMAKGVDEDRIEPRYPVLECPSCGGSVRLSEREDVVTVLKSCVMDSSMHHHENHYDVTYGICSCGYNYEHKVLTSSVCIDGIPR